MNDLSDVKWFTCTNEDCNGYGIPQPIAREAPADCRICRWSLQPYELYLEMTLPKDPT